MGTLIALIGVVLAIWQLRRHNQQQLAEMEDELVDQYRSIVKDLPSSAFLQPLPGEKKEIDGFFDDNGRGEEGAKEKTRNAFYRYIDLTNQQISLRHEGRIDLKTWVFWMEGMKAMFALPQFKAAWDFVSKRTDWEGGKITFCFFKEFRWLKDRNFEKGTDPKNEKSFHCSKQCLGSKQPNDTEKLQSWPGVCPSKRQIS